MLFTKLLLVASAVIVALMGVGTIPARADLVNKATTRIFATKEATRDIDASTTVTSNMVSRAPWSYAPADCSTQNYHCLVADTTDERWGGFKNLFGCGPQHTVNQTDQIVYYFRGSCEGQGITRCFAPGGSTRQRGIFDFSFGKQGGGGSAFGTTDPYSKGLDSAGDPIEKESGRVVTSQPWADLLITCRY